MPSKSVVNYHLVYRYLNHFFKAVDEHSLQAPFIYDVYCNVIKAEKDYDVFNEVEQLRHKLLRNQSFVELTNYGASSKALFSDTRKVCDITRTSVSPSKTSRLLFRLINYQNPSTTLELGTSVGINTLYLASANSQNKVYTFEGCPELSSIALENFRTLNKSNIELITGNIDSTLPPFLERLEKIDFAYIDANHRYASTLNYFNLLLSRSHEGTVMIFDDIHWSKEMSQAWKKICSNPHVGLSIDLFSSGIIFLKKFFNKQHYVLSF